MIRMWSMRVQNRYMAIKESAPTNIEEKIPKCILISFHIWLILPPMYMLQWNKYIEKADAEKKFIILLLPISIFLKNKNKYIAIIIITGLR